MANKVKIDYSQFKASGVYTLEFDASQNVILTSQTIRLVVGFSNQGPFNTPVYIPDATTMISIFGNIDTTLENRGSFFHRSILTCLNAGPVFALNLLKLNDDLESSDPDEVTYRAFSVDTEEYNGEVTNRLYSSYYNKERFWFADPHYFLATMSIPDQGKLLGLTNLGKSPMSIIVRKSTDSTTPLLGYNVFAVNWYGANNVPSFMHPYDYISDYFIDVIAVYGNWTNYQALSVDPYWGYQDPALGGNGGGYFTNNGFVKSKIDAFLADPNVSLVTSVTGSIIPNFVDLNGVNQYIQTLVNNNTPSTGLFCAVDEKAFDDICNNTSRIDLVGNHLIDELTSSRDLVRPRINFLSYDQALEADYLYTEKVVGVTGATGFVLSPGVTAYTSGIKVGTLYTLSGTEGATAGVFSTSFDAYDPALYEGGLHYLQTSGLTGTAGGFNNAAQKLALKDFLTVNSSDDQKFIIGVVTGVAGLTGTLINQFNEADLVKLKVTGTSDNGGELRIFFTHPLDTPLYISQGVSVKPTSNLISYNTGASGSNEVLYTGAYQFGNSNYFDREILQNINGVTGPGAPLGYAQGLVAYNASPLYQANKFLEIRDGDTIWTNSAGTSEQYLGFQNTIDRDQFNVTYARAYSQASRPANSLIDIATFGGGSLPSYASNNVGLPVGYQNIDIVSEIGSINSYIDVTKIDVTTFLVSEDSQGNVPFSVGDLIVSTDLDICIPASGNRQSRLAKIKTVAATTTTGVYKVISTRPILYYTADTGVRVQKFESIPQFTNSFDFTYLKGFTMKERHRPNGSDARLKEILGVMYDTNIAKTLAAKDIISFRYIIDTFNGIIGPESKSEFSRLAMLRQQALAIINAPSMSQFRASTDPRFTDAPTAVNPYPSLKTSYIVDGGNLSLNPTYTFTLPNEGDGSKFCAFYSPFITVRDNNKNINVPPAALVSNNFIRKFAVGEPYAIVAGHKRGILSGGNIVGVEYDFTDDDRANLEPFGINPIVKRKGVGVVIMGNSTAYQIVNSAFNLVHVRDLLISIENDVQEILANYLFDFNEDSIRLEIKTLVDNYLDGVRAGGGIYAYQTIMDSSNNTPAIIDMNMGIIDIIIEPARGIQKFVNRITVTRTGGIASGGFIQFV
jgi:hypothetical protein